MDPDTTPKTSELAAQGEITRLLAVWQRGDPSAADELFPLIYGELRGMARRHIGRSAGETLQATAVVHEAFVKLVGGAEHRFASRGHFYAVASKAMRQIVIDHARMRAARKRGGDRVRVDLDEERIPIEERAAEIVMVDEALVRLGKLDSALVRIVEMRFFSGLSIEEIAQAVGSSPSTVKRDWQKARAFLYRELAIHEVS